MTEAEDDKHTTHPHHAELVNADGSWKYTNVLAKETSPYLRQHAHNPVDWLPWGQDAFDKARREGKPIFLSIGYSTCYWCHVMERQVFENPVIAAQMNDLYVNIKVDREERPDVDDIYMTATQLMTQRGGWPMSVFLTPPDGASEEDPGLKPFWCGTYIPPEPTHGMASFPQVLEALSKAWHGDRENVLEQADRVAEAVRHQLGDAITPGPVSTETIDRAVSQLMQSYDADHAGFCGAPKFPQPSNLAFLLAVHRNHAEHGGDAQGSPVLRAVMHTLDRMARGGMYDQVGGGFHRYSTDAAWLVPHFEKMLYDNGQLVSVYADALDLLRDSEHAETHGPAIAQYERVLRDTCDYVLREMTDTSGAFWSAQDAEVNALEGGNYVWTYDEVQRAIPDEALAGFALKLYGLDRGTNFTDPHAADAQAVNVLFLPEPLHALAAARPGGMKQLLADRAEVNRLLKVVRDGRDQPGTDDKVLVAWNGMMISGLAKAGRVLDEPRYIQAASHAAEAILRDMSTADGGLCRTMRGGAAKIPAFLEDYAFLVHGLLELHRAKAAGDSRCLEQAKAFAQRISQRFASSQGGYFDTLADQSDLFVRTRSTYDGAIPSGNSQMLHNLIDLYELTGDEGYLDQAKQDARSFADDMQHTSVGMVHMQHALLRLLESSPKMAAFAAAAQTSDAPEVTPQAVRVSVSPAEAAWDGDVAGFSLVVDVADTMHIHSHTVDDPSLTPTSLTLEHEGVTLEALFPKAKSKRYPFADQPLPVHDGRFEIHVRLKRETGVELSVARLWLHYQACTETACLPPNTLEVPLRMR